MSRAVAPAWSGSPREAMGAENQQDDVLDIGQSQGCDTVLPAQRVWVAADISGLPTMTHYVRTTKGIERPAGRVATRFLTGKGEWCLMVTISLKQSAAGDWRICRCQITLFSDLQLGAAIKLAREMARDEHQRLGRRVCVEMPGPISMIVLARYADDDAESESNTRDALAA